jgi:hypothetical protein
MAKKTNGLLKNHRSPFESLRANGAELEIAQPFTFVLSQSKHSDLFSTAC